MTMRSPAGAAMVLVAGLVAGCGGAATKTAVSSQCQPRSGLTATARTASYRMVLDVAPVEQMYTQAQVAEMHPTMGEVMLRGEMGSVPGMTMPGAGSSMAGPATTMGTPTTMSPATTMGSGSSPTTGDQSNARHLEIHICSAASGRVISTAQPSITLVDISAANRATQVPVAVMEGIGEGVADLHYGNNVVMPPGHAYTVTVRLNGETATFHVRTPKM